MPTKTDTIKHFKPKSPEFKKPLNVRLEDLKNKKNTQKSEQLALKELVRSILIAFNLIK
jgi:hypothetical protein